MKRGKHPPVVSAAGGDSAISRKNGRLTGYNFILSELRRQRASVMLIGQDTPIYSVSTRGTATGGVWQVGKITPLFPLSTSLLVWYNMSLVQCIA